MRDEYDFTNAVRNPYAKHLSTEITLGVANPVVDYFKGLSEKTGIPWRTLINLYLADCAENHREPVVTWPTVSPARSE